MTMTPREVFDTVKAHLLAQNAQAISEFSGSCKYRTSTGLKCAVGCLIPESLYRTGAEGWGVSSLGILDEDQGTWYAQGDGDADPLAAMLNEAGIPASSEMKDLLMRLQTAHDSYGAQDWPDQLETIEANFFGPEAVSQ